MNATTPLRPKHVQFLRWLPAIRWAGMFPVACLTVAVLLFFPGNVISALQPALFIYTCKIVAPAFRWQIAMGLACVFFAWIGTGDCYCSSIDNPSLLNRLLEYWWTIALNAVAVVVPTSWTARLDNVKTRLLSAVFMVTVSIIFLGSIALAFSITALLQIHFLDPTPFPTDANLRELFITKHALLDRIAQMAVKDSKDTHDGMFIQTQAPIAFGQPSAAPRYRKLLKELGRPVTIIGLDNGVRFDFDNGTIRGKLRMARSWMDWSKGLEYISKPSDELLHSHPKSLDDLRQVATSDMTIALGGGWYIIVYVSDGD